MELPERETKPSLRFNVGWEQFHQDAKALAWKLAQCYDPFVGIIALTRGGMIPAAIIAYELKIKYIDTFCLTSYEYQTQSQVTALKQPLVWNTKNILVIDDLTDTGKTFEYVQQLLPQCHYACVYVKPAGKAAVDSYLTEVSQDTWIHFPWD